MSGWNWPQIIVACILALGPIMGFVNRNKSSDDVAISVFASATMALLLGWGNFWN